MRTLQCLCVSMRPGWKSRTHPHKCLSQASHEGRRMRSSVGASFESFPSCVRAHDSLTVADEAKTKSLMQKSIAERGSQCVLRCGPFLQRADHGVRIDHTSRNGAACRKHLTTDGLVADFLASRHPWVRSAHPHVCDPMMFLTPKPTARRAQAVQPLVFRPQGRGLQGHCSRSKTCFSHGLDVCVSRVDACKCAS